MIEVDIDFETHEFCQRCGSKMSPVYLVDTAPYRYNKITGKPMFMVAKRCSTLSALTDKRRQFYNEDHDYRTSLTEEIAPDVR